MSSQSFNVSGETISRETALALIWKHTHADFKGRLADGTRCVLHFVAGEGTCSAPLDSLADEVILDRVCSAVIRERKAAQS